MSNAFKTNTRFSALMDKTSIPRKHVNEKVVSYDVQFPELIGNNNKPTSLNVPSYSYIDKVTNVAISNEDETELLLKPGWVLLKRDQATNKTNFNYHPLTKYSRKNPKSENEIACSIMEKLASAYEKRTDEYITNYGYDEWETRFKFPDWRECEIYLEKMDELMNNSDDNTDNQNDMELELDSDNDIYYDND